ncbi:MAG: hypothetical protein JWR29_106, partial [Tardiphaga sp.]|nr:hypothetical protein [Tardiphaga sp.]
RKLDSVRGAVEIWRAPCELKDSPDMTRNSAQRLAQAVAAFGRPRLGACLPVLIALMMLASSPAATQPTPIKGNAALAVSGGFARMLIKLDEDVEADASVAGNILVVRFKGPVEVDIGRLSDAAPDYVSSARRDPDGMAIRFALSRKVTLNAMMAGERTFIDLLPDTWTGLPPGLPQSVVRELAERTRTAERALKQQKIVAETRKRAPLRLRAAVQPTFVRFSVELPDGVGVSSALMDQKLILSFNGVLTFDLADAKLAAPANVGAITQRSEGDASTIEIGLIGDVDVRSFREDKTFMVDVGAQQAEKPALVKPAAKPAASVPANEQTANRNDNAPAQPTSDSIAQLVSRDAASQPKVEPKTEGLIDPKIEAPKIEPKSDLKVVEPAALSPVASATPVAAQPVAAVSPSATDKPAGSIDARRSGDGLKLNLTFATPTPAALFRRADVMWLVLDGDSALDPAPIKREGGALIGDVGALKLPHGQAIRIRLNRPQLASLTAADATASGKVWTLSFADALQSAPLPLTLVRNIVDPTHAKATVPLAGAGRLHRLVDPDAGDALTVVTAPPPPRGFIRRQDFVEFSILESIHGVVVQANADDVSVDVDNDGVVLTRPGGLTLSPTIAGHERATLAVKPMFDLQEWQANERAPFIARRDELIRTLAQASPSNRMAARADLAQFYFSRAMYHEARGVLNVMIGETAAGDEDAPTLLMHAAASALIGRPDQALKTIANPALSASSDTQLWTGLALAAQGKWALAREKFKNAGFALASLPFELQRAVLVPAMRASLEVKDYAGAASRSSELDLVGVPPSLMPAVSVLRGRLAEALGREQDAMTDYYAAIASVHSPAAAEARLLAVALRQKRDDITPDESLQELETLSAMWRGDGIETKTMQALAKIYAESGRYTEALSAARTATHLDGNSDVARQLQDDASALFAQMYLTSKGDNIPPIAALAAFYENSELTPIGRKGDEMIRRLVERLVSVDLLDQAGELLQYQIDNRLEGAARAQVAARLAMIYLMNRKPDRAIGALHATRIADLAGELRQQRLLLEARAQSDIGRRDLALDIISNSAGREAIRLRADINWAARRWREASEQIELYYGDRWRDFQPLNTT